MNDRQQIAEHVTHLCVGALAAMGLDASALVPAAVLTACGLDRVKGRRAARGADAIAATLKTLEALDPEATRIAATILHERKDAIRIDPDALADAETRNAFPDTLYDVAFAGAGVPEDGGTETVLREAMRAAYGQIRETDAFHRIYIQEAVADLERVAAARGVVLKRIEAITTQTHTTVRAISEDVAAIKRSAKDKDLRRSSVERAVGFSYMNLIATTNAGTYSVEEICDLVGALNTSGLSIDDAIRAIQDKA